MSAAPKAACAIAVLSLAACAGTAAAPSAAPPVIANTGLGLSAAGLTFDLGRADRRVAPPVAADLDRYLALATPSGRGDALVATIATSLGDLECTLDIEHRPMTVANFLGLATGLKAWKDPELGDTMIGEPFYDGTMFHRIIRGFMIQGGDRLGTGTGGPGYRFDDELADGLGNVAGTLVMANAGANTNGSQFFINHVDNDRLDGKHAVFGQCEPADVIDALASVETGTRDRPQEPVFLLGITFRWR